MIGGTIKDMVPYVESVCRQHQNAVYRQTDRGTEMKIQQIEASETRKPAPSPMNLDVGRLTAREALTLFGVATGTLLAAALGGLLWWLAVPTTNGALVLVALFGIGMAIMGSVFTFVVARLGITSWYSYERRLDDWHEITLAAYETSGGAETSRTIRQWELTADDFRDVLLIALGVHSRVVAGTSTPWSVREIEGAIWLGGKRLGDVASGDAERVSKVLAESGLIIDRAPRKAGRWAAGSYDEVVEILVKGYGK